MRIIDSQKIKDLAHFIAGHKHNYADWHFMSILVYNPEVTPRSLFKLFPLKCDSAWILKSEHALLVLYHKKDSLLMGLFEKELTGKYSSNDLTINTRSLAGEGIYQYSSALRASADSLSTACSIAVQRMERTTNSAMILDDDEMILKQMEKILSNFADALTISTPERFFDLYKQYAPDIVFLDIHLGQANGCEILRKLKNEIDPNAYVIMISSDTQQKTILELKASGVDGFLMKPINKNRVYNWIMQSPSANVYRKTD